MPKKEDDFKIILCNRGFQWVSYHKGPVSINVRYKVGTQIGKGSFSIVYSAMDLVLNSTLFVINKGKMRRVAIKMVGNVFQDLNEAKRILVRSYCFL